MDQVTSTSAISRQQRLDLLALKCEEVDCGGYLINAPKFLVNAFKIIDENGGNVGIFRKSGQQKRVQQLKAAFFGDPIPDNATVDDVCGAVKAFFRDLEEPLLNSTVEKQLILYTRTITNESVRLQSVLQLCRVLKQRHRETLAFLTWQLKQLAKRSSENLMGVDNLATIFAMSLFRDQDFLAVGGIEKQKKTALLKTTVVTFLIENAEELCALARFSEEMPSKRRQHFAVLTPFKRMRTIGDVRGLLSTSKAENAQRKAQTREANCDSPSMLHLETPITNNLLRRLSCSTVKKRQGAEVEPKRLDFVQKKLRRSQRNLFSVGLSKLKSKYEGFPFS